MSQKVLYTGQLHTLTFVKNGLKIGFLYCMDTLSLLYGYPSYPGDTKHYCN